MQNKSVTHHWRGRRAFLRWLTLGFGSLAGLLTAFIVYKDRRYKSNNRVNTGNNTGKANEFISVAKLEDLADGPFKVRNAFGRNTSTVWLSGNSQDQNSILALDATCPHEGCDVDWQGESYLCPCHGATFAADGSRIRGPAKIGLKAYEVRVENGEILVAKP
ncbi:MAG: QcrA and Rieske domain-containing protein [Cyanobacteriota bacterium]